jgi:hypothetical protein
VTQIEPAIRPLMQATPHETAGSKRGGNYADRAENRSDQREH